MQLCCHANSSTDVDMRKPGCNRKDNGELVNLKTDLADAYWNTYYMTNVRKQMLNGEKPRACKACYDEEALGYRSKRQWENEDWSKKIDFADITNTVDGDGTMPYNIQYIDMKLGNKCDLACITCNPADSTSWIPLQKQLEEIGSEELLKQRQWNKNEAGGYNWWKNNESYWNSVYANLPTLRHIYIIGGEPVINSEFYAFVKHCVDSGHAEHIELRFNTNGHTEDPELVKLFSHFEHVLVHLSMDGIEHKHEYIRYPSTWNKMQSVLYYWDNMPDNVTVDLDCTVNALNVLHLPDFVRWKMNQGFKKINVRRFAGTVGLHLLWHPTFLQCNNLPDDLKELAVEQLQQLKIELGSTVTNKYKKFDAVINALQKPANNLNLLVEYLERMDSIRGTSWTQTFPELNSLKN
jgi:hypothetical protein